MVSSQIPHSFKYFLVQSTFLFLCRLSANGLERRIHSLWAQLSRDSSWFLQERIGLSLSSVTQPLSEFLAILKNVKDLLGPPVHHQHQESTPPKPDISDWAVIESKSSYPSVVPFLLPTLWIFPHWLCSSMSQLFWPGTKSIKLSQTRVLQIKNSEFDHHDRNGWTSAIIWTSRIFLLLSNTSPCKQRSSWIPVDSPTPACIHDHWKHSLD